MQKASYYDNPTLFGGYLYQAGGLGYEGPQQSFATSPLDNDFQRSSCSLQSLGHNGPLAKPKNINGSCMRPNLASEHHQASSLSPQSNPTATPGNSTSSAQAGAKSSSVKTQVPSNTTSKQIFPWMKESRQNSKQKSSPPATGTKSHHTHIASVYTISIYCTVQFNVIYWCMGAAILFLGEMTIVLLN